MSDRLLLSVDDAAAALSVSRRHVQELLYRGDLPSLKLGRARRIAVTDLQAYVDRLREEQLGRLEVVAR